MKRHSVNTSEALILSMKKILGIHLRRQKKNSCDHRVGFFSVFLLKSNDCETHPVMAAIEIMW